MRFLVLCAIVCLASVAPSCNESGVGPSPSILIPFSSGATWTFSYTFFDSEDQPILQQQTTLVVDSDTVIDGQRWSAIERFGTKLLYCNRYEGVGVWWLGHEAGYHIQYKCPAAVGDAYAYPIPSFGEGSAMHLDLYTAIVLTVDTVISVPAGVFHCIAYARFSVSQLRYRIEFLSLGTGWIKEDYFDRQNVSQTWKRSNTSELLQFHPGR
jgi:hypothetical protein